ncbi:uncharacterized protein [Clytia hemisphaerica]|uniref:uncharacterized protein n=1 Tax=Clytia hemisphaerica TaxID=252671 RepID=UPI0034D47120
MTKLRKEHVKLTPSSRMKVRLAAQVLSTTVANCLKYRNNPETKGTEEFCRNFDYFFDCLNGQYERQGIVTKKPALNPYKSVNDPRFDWLEKDFIKDYIIQWQEEAKSQIHLTKKERNKLCLSQPTFEGLQITVKSTVRLIKDLLLEYPGFLCIKWQIFSGSP